MRPSSNEPPTPSRLTGPMLDTVRPMRDACEESDEQALIRRARAGDRAAYDDLVKAHFERVFALLYRMIGNHEDAEDLAQECFVRAYLALPHYREEARFSTWLHRIAVHLALDHRRGALRRADLPWHELALAGEGASSAADAAPESNAGELSRRLAAALDRLPPRLRTALVLRTLEEREYPEVAELLGIKPATARTHVMQARKLLLRWLAPWTGGTEP